VVFDEALLVPGQGLQKIPFRIPAKWDAAWYEQHLREVLALADTRNAIEGPGIQISGQPGEEATISASDDLQNLLLQQFVVASASGFLQFERVLTAGDAIDIVDGGANSTISVGVEDHGITLGKLRELSGMGVLGNPVDDIGEVQVIQPEQDKAVLHQAGAALVFDLIDHTYVSDFDEAAQDAVGAALTDTASIDLVYADGANTISANIVDAYVAALILATLAPVTFLTEADETADFPGSRQLIAGTGITIDVSTPGELTLNSTGGSGGGVGPGPDDIPASPNAMDDEFNGVSLDAKWAWRNQGTSTTAFVAGSLRLIGQLNASAVNTRVIEQAVPVGTWRFRMRASGMLIGSGAYFGMCITANATGRQILLIAQNLNIGQFRMTSVTAFSASTGTNFTSARDGGLLQWRYYEMEYDGTNIITRQSQTGINGTFIQVATDPAASFLGTPTHIGLFNHPADASVASQLVCDWFRRMA
jgi:hypothetical protein